MRKSTEQVSRTRTCSASRCRRDCLGGSRVPRPFQSRYHEAGEQRQLFQPSRTSIKVAVMSSATALEAFLAEPRNVIVAGIRKDGRPHLSPNWFFWDGEHFYVSTTRKRAKYHIFRRDPRAELVVDDATGHRYVEIPTTVEVREDVPANIARFRAIREK